MHDPAVTALNVLIQIRCSAILACKRHRVLSDTIYDKDNYTKIERELRSELHCLRQARRILLQTREMIPHLKRLVA